MDGKDEGGLDLLIADRSFGSLLQTSAADQAGWLHDIRYGRRQLDRDWSVRALALRYLTQAAQCWGFLRVRMHGVKAEAAAMPVRKKQKPVARWIPSADRFA